MPAAGRGGVLLAAFAALSVSLSNVVTPAVYANGSNAQSLLVLRYIGFLVVCALIARWRPDAVGPRGRQRWVCYAVGICYTLGAGGLIASFAYAPVSLAILVFYTFPLITVTLESALDGRLPAPGQAALMLCAFAGVCLSLGVAPDYIDPRGVGFALLGACGIATSFVWSNRALPAVEPLLLTGHMSVSALVLSTVLVVATDSFALVEPSWPGWGALLGAAGLFWVAFLSMFVAVGKIGATRTAMVMNLEAVFTVLLAVLLLREYFSLVQTIGAVTVVAAVVAMQFGVGARVPQRAVVS